MWNGRHEPMGLTLKRETKAAWPCGSHSLLTSVMSKNQD